MSVTRSHLIKITVVYREWGAHVTLIAVVGWLVLHTTLVTDLFPCSHQLLPQNLDVLDGLHQAVSDRGRGWNTYCKQTHNITHTDVHRKRYYLIILKVSWSLILMVRATFQDTWIMGTIDLTFFTSFHSKRSRASWYWYAGRAINRQMWICKSRAANVYLLFLCSWWLTVEGSHIPGDVVAPAHCLDPVYSPCIDPHQVPRPLDEAVHRDVGAVEVFQDWPPGPCKVVYSMPKKKKNHHIHACIL